MNSVLSLSTLGAQTVVVPVLAPVRAPAQVRTATTYWQRLRGLLGTPRLADDEALWIDPCSSVHTFGMRYAIDVVFVDRDGVILEVTRDLAPWRAAWCSGARSVYEMAAGQARLRGIAAGQRWHTSSEPSARLEATRVTMKLRDRTSRGGPSGASSVEMVVIIPTAIFSILLVMQTALIFHYKNQANVAAVQAAREGAVSHASEFSIRAGFAKALVPAMGGGTTAGELAASFARATVEASPLGTAIQILSPNREAFDDFNSPDAADRLRAEGQTVEEPVIQNLNIQHLSCPIKSPRYADVPCDGDPMFNASGQSLKDANVLKLRVVWGIPPSKQVPLVGPLMVATMRGLSQVGFWVDNPEAAALLLLGRIPVSANAIVRMQSEPIRNRLMVSTGKANLATNYAMGEFLPAGTNTNNAAGPPPVGGEPVDSPPNSVQPDIAPPPRPPTTNPDGSPAPAPAPGMSPVPAPAPPPTYTPVPPPPSIFPGAPPPPGGGGTCNA